MSEQLRVLLVEDDPDDTVLVRRSLRDAPVALECFDRLAPALARLGSGGIDLVLSDLHLPDSDGIETVRRLKARAPWIPLVVLTGSAGSEAGIEAMRAGAQDYLRKEDVLGRHLDRALVYARERQEVERFKSDLLRMVTHELKSPLAGAFGFLELLRDGHAGALAERQREFVLKSLEGIKHVLAMVDDLGVAHRVGLGRLRVEARDVDVAAALGDVADALVWRAAEKGVDLAVEPPPALGLVRADPERLRQILTNLVDNALKFTQRGGRVTLSVLADAEPGYARFSVVDTGPGIPAEEAGKVFESLYQTAEGRQAGGLGLGLYIAREFVQAQGGRIWVDGRPGVGTAIRFTVPLAAVPTARGRG